MDRNPCGKAKPKCSLVSPPARVAWIETCLAPASAWVSVVATREGGVDRNRVNGRIVDGNDLSPPARVAWIETLEKGVADLGLAVATREGGVDRNRSKRKNVSCLYESPPARVAWIETQTHCLSLSALLSPPARVAWIETAPRP